MQSFLTTAYHDFLLYKLESPWIQVLTIVERPFIEHSNNTKEGQTTSTPITLSEEMHRVSIFDSAGSN